MEQRANLEPGKYYHIFNRGIAGTNIFIEPRNYALFLDLYTQHVAPLVSTYAYCLLHNHFHLFVQINSLQIRTQQTSEVSQTSEVLIHAASQAFSNFFNAYAKTINTTYSRTGALFEHRFRRLEVGSELYGMRLVHYIHFNPQKHAISADFRDYPHSSYRSILSDQPTRLERQRVLDWFGGDSGFVTIHKTLADEKTIWPLVCEDG
jgi:hypothetical protein